MRKYTVRVELHSNQYSDFEMLHQAMAQKGFSKLITSGGGEIYHLPRGEYSIETPSDLSWVLGSVKNAVQETGQDAEILVTESRGRTWHGLTKKANS